MWLGGFERWHSGAVCLLLAGLCLGAGALPRFDAGTWSVSVLLVGGALIGVPHGGTDFVVAHRLLSLRCGPGWLPVFVSAYLAVVCAVMAGWFYLPLTTLLLFLTVSALHFGWREEGKRPPVSFLVTATIPVLPIFMFHPDEVGPVLAAMAGASESDAVAALHRLGAVALWPWTVLLVATAIAGLRARRPAQGWMTEVTELGLLSLAALLLPPFLTFGLYFCLLHAVRHMSALSSQAHPRDPAKALLFAFTIIVPFAAVCAGLVLFWDRLAGTVPTPTLVQHALQLLAALTIPHMGLEVLSWLKVEQSRGRVQGSRF